MNGQDLLSTRNVKDKDLGLKDTNIVKISRSKIGYFSAITLPLILAACGGGGVLLHPGPWACSTLVLGPALLGPSPSPCVSGVMPSLAPASFGGMPMALATPVGTMHSLAPASDGGGMPMAVASPIGDGTYAFCYQPSASTSWPGFDASRQAE